jgi:hypothetical protein
MAEDSRQISGKVVRKPVASGSKSEHEAVMLRTADGEELLLRRLGGNAFRDPQLDDLVGASITGEGQVAGRTFIMRSWKVDRK